MSLQPGDLLLNGQYRILRLLGRGGFGFVYLAQDTLLQEEVALKELIPALVGDEAQLKRFLAEAKATMRLRHERIVGTHNVFSERGNYYIVMEYMAGGSLEARLQERGALSVEQAVQIAAEVAEGLGCAHGLRVVHCDLKPANILFTADGHAKVADFGIAHVPREMFSRSWATAAGFVAGTLPYMSPEQADGVRDDPRADLYALAAVLYRMLAGRPYLEFDERDTPGAQARNVQRILSEPPQPPSFYNRRVPAWLDAVILKALTKRPEERYASAAEMREALRREEVAAPPRPDAAEPAVPKPPTRPQPQPQPWPKWFWPVAGGTAAALVVTVIAVALIMGGLTGRGGAPPALSAVPKPAPGIGSTQASPADGMALVYVPAGEFLMGSADGDPAAASDERPQHTVYLDAYWIDRTEVTKDQYRRCVDAGKCAAPACSGTGQGDHPVVCVTWQDAVSYCAWAGRRLPSEAEWEKAARGTGGRIYPWGYDAPDCNRLNYEGKEGGCVGNTTTVGSYLAGASPYGALDMAGNVWEWVADRYDAGYYADSPAQNPRGPDSGNSFVLRGGSWYNSQGLVRAAFRIRFVPVYRYNYIGFRCARSD